MMESPRKTDAEEQPPTHQINGVDCNGAADHISGTGERTPLKSLASKSVKDVVEGAVVNGCEGITENEERDGISMPKSESGADTKSLEVGKTGCSGEVESQSLEAPESMSQDDSNISVPVTSKDMAKEDTNKDFGEKLHDKNDILDEKEVSGIDKNCNNHKDGVEEEKYKACDDITEVQSESGSVVEEGASEKISEDKKDDAHKVKDKEDDSPKVNDKKEDSPKINYTSQMHKIEIEEGASEKIGEDKKDDAHKVNDKKEDSPKVKDKEEDSPKMKDKKEDSPKINDTSQMHKIDEGEQDTSQENETKKNQAPNSLVSKNPSDSAGDDIEIIGESHVPPSQLKSDVVFVKSKPANVPSQLSNIPTNFGSGTSLLTGANVQNTLLLQNMNTSNLQPNIMGNSPGSSNYIYPLGLAHNQSMPVFNSAPKAPPTPKSSMDQIELIRWEIQNRINIRPKYFKPNPSSELGPLAKFLFDVGSDLIKESVYHDLVKIQSKKNDEDKLSEKERDDLAKLKEIEKDLHATIGHLKLRLKKRCHGCGFQTESNNVLFHHQLFPHEDNKNLRCPHCSFSTKQSITFKTHMEFEHGMQGKLHDKKAFFECHMCPYENNQEQKLILHRERCIKQFRPLFNLHPSCLSGAEINLCLENIFYKPVVPKNLKLLQQKHAQQQAALAEARRQQAQMQMIAAQKSAAALVAKKQLQEQQQRIQQQQQQLQKQRQQLPQLASRYGTPTNVRGQIPSRVGVVAQQQPQIPQPRYSSKAARPAAPNMLNNKNNNNTLPSPPGGFEVCEICGGYVKDRKALRIHFFYAHRIDLPFNLFERNQAPLYCATCYVRFWTAQGLRKHIDTHKEENQTKGVVGKCISCGHQVLNLLLHMRIVHNRELQHYINALMCMFCGGHFSSRQDCERHIIKTHGNVDTVTGTIKSPPSGSQGVSPQSASSKSSHKKSSKVGGNNNLVKGSVCVLCNLNFGRNVDLTRHCMRMHHTCMKCGMVVIDKASLLKHTCLTSPSGTRDCGMCGETGFHPAYYVKHLRDKHLRKFSIKVAKVSREVIERWTKRPCPFDDPQEVLVEIIDSDDESSASSKEQKQVRVTKSHFCPPKKPKIGPACSKVKQPMKKRRIGPASKIGRRPINYVPDYEENQENIETADSGVKDVEENGSNAEQNGKCSDRDNSEGDIKLTERDLRRRSAEKRASLSAEGPERKSRRGSEGVVQ